MTGHASWLANFLMAAGIGAGNHTALVAPRFNLLDKMLRKGIGAGNHTALVAPRSNLIFLIEKC
jgi:hypothetical protein